MTRKVWHVFTTVRQVEEDDVPEWFHETAFTSRADARAEAEDYREHDMIARVVQGPSDTAWIVQTTKELNAARTLNPRSVR